MRKSEDYSIVCLTRWSRRVDHNSGVANPELEWHECNRHFSVESCNEFGELILMELDPQSIIAQFRSSLHVELAVEVIAGEIMRLQFYRFYTA
jgi:hypothetical protein